MRISSIVAAITTVKGRQEVRLRPTTALRNHKTEGSGKTRCKANRPPTGEAKAEVRVKAREGDAEQGKDYIPIMYDAPF